MVWAVVAAIASFAIRVAILEKRALQIEKAFGSLKIKSVVVKRRIDKVKEFLLNDIEEARGKMPSSFKEVIKNKFVNHLGSQVFGEMWYVFKYGFKDNFFWNHPLLDMLAHKNDKSKRKFLAEWMTLYQLPSELRVIIKIFAKNNSAIKKLEKYGEKYDALYDNLFSKLQKYQGRVINSAEEIEQMKSEISIGMEDIKTHHKKYKNLTVQSTAELIKYSISYNKSQAVEIMADALKLVLDDNPEEIIRKVLGMLMSEFSRDKKNISLGYFLSLYGYVSTASFIPNSPETGNFYGAKYNYLSHVLSLSIHPAWYGVGKSHYDFSASVGGAQECALTPNFGKFYNKNLPHRKVPRPSVAASVNFNGTEAIKKRSS